MKKAIKLLVFMFCISTLTNAQNIKEAIQNTKQIIEGKKNLERDIKELKALKVKLQLFNSAFDSKKSSKVNELKTNILTDMIREVKQSNEKSVKARREIAQSSSEIRSDRNENRSNQQDSKKGRFDKDDDRRDATRDRANTKDDMRDRRDDIKDFKQQIARAELQSNILKKIKVVNFSFKERDLASAVVNKKMILEFVSSLEEDLIATKRELAEDKREQREDVRERQDDRNERNEIDTKNGRRGR